MKSQSALVGSNRTVHLYPESPVDLEISAVVIPWDPELNNPLGLDYSLDYWNVFWLFFDHGTQALENFLYCLVELRLIRITGLNTVVNFFHGFVHFNSHLIWRFLIPVLPLARTDTPLLNSTH